ncbi:hypothetical protein [Nonomuraea zeae]|uniref:hypothetical protein n=1 Tax=Nonomuraea zeae TaxID=1642303 RepID=UPI0014788F69|nr:hypothetical protein [Nonomuraea zeae]
MTLTWTAAFRSAPVSPYEPMTLIHSPRGFAGQTLRQVVRVRTVRLRVQLSNLYGRQPLTIARTHVAGHATAAAVNIGTDTVVTFGGVPRVTIPPGQEANNDLIDFATDLSISTYHPTTPMTRSLPPTIPSLCRPAM